MKKSRRTYNGVHLNKKSNTQDVVEQSLTFFPSSRERRGGKGKAEPLKPIFLLILEWMKLKKVIKNSLFPPLFPHFPSFFPFEAGKEK